MPPCVRAERMQRSGRSSGRQGSTWPRCSCENVSNVAYYADSIPSDDPIYRIRVVLTGILPVVVYGGLAWVMFRRFYRVHIAAPLEGLGAAAQRIAEQDLDFSIEPVQGKELGALGATLEDMRASLLSAQRELWRTAEERRRLNAAFAHDLRTPGDGPARYGRFGQDALGARGGRGRGAARLRCPNRSTV